MNEHIGEYMNQDALIEQYENAARMYPMYARYYCRRIDEMKKREE